MSDDGIVHKDHLNARAAAPKPKPEPDGLVFGRRHFPGSVDLAHAATLPEWAGQGARIMDVARTVDAASAALCEAMAEFMGKKLGRERKLTNGQIADVEKQLDDLRKRVSAAESESLDLRSLTAELRGELADAVHEIEKLRALRGNSDGRQLPSSITTPKTRPRRKRAAGATAEASPP
jgi:hypothetical protein